MKGDVGSIGQNHIRPDVVQQIADEMLCCDINQFLYHYAPFVPSKRSVNNALQKLKHKGLLCNNKWRDFSGDNIPSQTGEIETKAFKKLEAIVKVLMGQKCSGTDSKGSRKCNLNYHNCGDTQMVGEISGSTFRIDAYFSSEYSPPLFKSEKVVVSQVAVAGEFKKNRKDFYDVCTQILNIDVFSYGDSESPKVGQCSQSHHE